MKRYENKVCVITESATGIGLAIARRMGQEGGKIVISSRNQKHIEAAVNDLRKEGIIAEGVVCYAGIDRQKLVDFAADKFGGIDVLVNNEAVTTGISPTKEISEQAYDRMPDIDIKAWAFLITAALPWLMQSKNPAILFVSRNGGFDPSHEIGIHCITRADIKMLWAEFADAGIRVNAISTEVTKAAFSESAWELTKNSMNMMGILEECSHVAAFLCSEEASHVNGAIVVCAGGFHSRL